MESALLLQLKRATQFQLKMVTFSSCKIQIYTKFTISRRHIFHVLQHLATKLGNSTNFSMLLLAVLKDFVPLAEIES